MPARWRIRRSCSRARRLELDERGFKKLNKLMAKTLDQALAIAAESSERRNKGAEVFGTEIGLLHFKREPAGE